MRRVKKNNKRKLSKKRTRIKNKRFSDNAYSDYECNDYKWYTKRCSYIENNKKSNKKSNGFCNYTPEQLYEAACEYFLYTETHPLYERKVAGSYMGEPMMVDLPKRRPMSLQGLLIYLELTLASWYEYYKTTKEYLDVTMFIEMVIREQKFAGAATGFFKENLIIRDLGMADKQDITSNGETVQQKNVIVLPAKE